MSKFKGKNAWEDALMVKKEQLEFYVFGPSLWLNRLRPILSQWELTYHMFRVCFHLRVDINIIENR